MQDVFKQLGDILKPETAIKINVLGKIHDASKELELFPDNEFGFNVKFTYKEVNRKDYQLYKENETETYHNVTEFHYLHDKTSIACESDIHCTGSGGHDKVLHTKSIVITLATKKHRNF